MINRENMNRFKKPPKKDGKDLVDILLDENNTDNITLVDEQGNEVEFQQIAIIPYNETIYCLLVPVNGLPGVANDEFLVFYLYEDEDTDDAVLKVCVDEEIIDELYKQYLQMLEESV